MGDNTNKRKADDNDSYTSPNKKVKVEEVAKERGEAGKRMMGFGKYKRKTYYHVAQNDGSYCKWCLSLPTPSPAMALFQEYLRKYGHQSPISIYDAYDICSYFDDVACYEVEQERKGENEGGGYASKKRKYTKEQQELLDIKIGLNLPGGDDTHCSVCNKEIKIEECPRCEGSLPNCLRENAMQEGHTIVGRYECKECANEFTCAYCGGYVCKVCREDDDGDWGLDFNIYWEMSKCQTCKSNILMECRESCTRCCMEVCRKCLNEMRPAWYECTGCSQWSIDNAPDLQIHSSYLCPNCVAKGLNKVPCGLNNGFAKHEWVKITEI